MNITLTALLFDQFGRVLLTEDPATGTLVPPAAPLPPGAPPLDALAAALRDQTGLIALPVRLSGLYARPDGLTLAFRAIQRGGAIRRVDDAEDGRPVAGFFDAIPAPEPLGPAARQQLDDALHHTGGPPVAAPAAAGLLGRLQRALAPGSTAGAGPWTAAATLVVTDGEGRVAWWGDETAYRLPETAIAVGELPGAAAARLARLVGLGSEPVLRTVLVAAEQPVVYFVYALTAAATPGDTQARPGEEPAACDAGHVAQVAAMPPAGDPAPDVVVAVLPSARLPAA